MIKIVPLSEDDILFDEEAAGEALEKAAHRLKPVRFTGGFDTLGTFFIGDDLWGLFKRLPDNA